MASKFEALVKEELAHAQEKILSGYQRCCAESNAKPLETSIKAPESVCLLAKPEAADDVEVSDCGTDSSEDASIMSSPSKSKSPQEPASPTTPVRVSFDVTNDAHEKKNSGTVSTSGSHSPLVFDSFTSSLQDISAQRGSTMSEVYNSNSQDSRVSISSVAIPSTSSSNNKESLLSVLPGVLEDEAPRNSRKVCMNMTPIDSETSDGATPERHRYVSTGSNSSHSLDSPRLSGNAARRGTNLGSTLQTSSAQRPSVLKPRSPSIVSLSQPSLTRKSTSGVLSGRVSVHRNLDAPVLELHEVLQEGLESFDHQVMEDKSELFEQANSHRGSAITYRDIHEKQLEKRMPRQSLRSDTGRQFAKAKKKGFWSRCTPRVADPSSPRRIWWDAIGAVLICYDMVFIPLTIFEIPRTGFFIFMQWLCFIFWCCDLPATFFVGVNIKGVLEMNLRVTARRYLRTFFVLDVLLISIDATVICMDILSGQTSSSDAAGVARSYRMVRILRGLRLIRLLKLPKNLESLLQHIHSERVVVTLGIAKLTTGVLLLNHFIACLWYTLCKWGKAEDSWLHTTVGEHLRQDLAYLYMTSLHWSLTQFTPASMEVYPAALHERLFAVIVIMFALVTFSSFISSITNAMETLRNMNSENHKNLSVLQMFFRTHSISLSLSARVTRYVQFKLAHSQLAISEKDVKMLQLLSLPLRIDLHYEVHSPRLKRHTFFAVFDGHFQRCMSLICHKSIEEINVCEGDTLFALGDRAKHFLIINTGNVKYTHSIRGDRELQEGQWLAEAGFWTPWTHRGGAQATVETMLNSVDYEQFLECFLDNAASADCGCPTHYAHIFVQHLKAQNVDDLSDLADPTFNINLAVNIAFHEMMEEQNVTAVHTIRDSFVSRKDFSSGRRVSGSSSVGGADSQMGETS